MSDFRLLHGPHSTWRFSTLVDPPFEYGIMWSTCRSDSRPQCTQRPLSRRMTSATTSRGICRFFEFPRRYTSEPSSWNRPSRHLCSSVRTSPSSVCASTSSRRRNNRRSSSSGRSSIGSVFFDGPLYGTLSSGAFFCLSASPLPPKAPAHADGLSANGFRNCPGICGENA